MVLINVVGLVKRRAPKGRWNDDFQVAAFSVTDEKFLEDFGRWIKWHGKYKLEISGLEDGSEHK